MILIADESIYNFINCVSIKMFDVTCRRLHLFDQQFKMQNIQFASTWDKWQQ